MLVILIYTGIDNLLFYFINFKLIIYKINYNLIIYKINYNQVFKMLKNDN